MIDLLVALAVASSPSPSPTGSSTSTPIAARRVLDVPGFGSVPVRAPAAPPDRVVIFLTGSGGWNAEAEAFADALAARGALVLGVDSPAELRGAGGARCLYPAGRLETLAQRTEKALGLAHYVRPLLVGHSLGASLAWAAEVGGPAGTFAGAVLLGACPSHPIPVRPCAGGGVAPRAVEGGWIVPPPPRLEGSVAFLSGAEDETCPAADAEAFARAAPGARFELRRGLAHALVPAAAWAEAALAAAPSSAPSAPEPAQAGDGAASAPPVRDLPVVEVPAPGKGRRLAVMLTGDGGWVGLDKGVGNGLVGAGVAVVGLDSLRYFWSRKSPDRTARDVARIILHYRAAWSRDEVILVGYSRGADILPFVAARLPPEVRSSLKLVAMLGPGTYADFEVHVVDLFSSFRRRSATSTRRAVEAVGGSVPLLCIQGADEHDSLCPLIEGRPEVKRVVLTGGHHFDKDYGKLAGLIVEAAGP